MNVERIERNKEKKEKRKRRKYILKQRLKNDINAKLVTVVEGDPKAPLSITTTSNYRG